MRYSRRDFIKTGSMAAAAYGVAPTIITDWKSPIRETSYFPDDDEALLKQLAATALQAAKEGGATYADVRFSRTRTIKVEAGSTDVEPPWQFNLVQVGVRVLLDNTWGFAAMSTRSNDEVAKVARTAIRQAKTSAWEGRSNIVLAEAPKVENGKWNMPVKIDPIDVSVDEMLEKIYSGHRAVQKYTDIANIHTRIDFWRNDLAFANSEGSFTIQRTYGAIPLFPSYGEIAVKNADGSETQSVFAPSFWLRGAGWEAFKEVDYAAELEQCYQRAKEALKAPEVQPGLYEVVLRGESMCAIVDSTWNDHTQLDRALGYEANASGTSFVAPPEDVLGKKMVGNDMLTVKCNRDHPLSPANVKWDVEGVAAEEFTVIDKGRIVDYQTTREQVDWIKDYYTASGKPLKSHGCADSVGSGNVQIQAAPNVLMQAGTKDTKLDDLFSGIDKGMYFEEGFAWTDQQGVTGQHGLLGFAWEIRKGKKIGMVKNAGLIFKTEELFKKLQALGGQSTYVFRGGGKIKGEPAQIGLPCGTGAPATRIKDGRVTNISRKPV
jgi:TldD protein